MRLNGWQRIGVVASIAWAIGGAAWGYEIGTREGDFTREYYARCSDAAYNQASHQSPTPKLAIKQLEDDLLTCQVQEAKRHAAATSNQAPYALMMGLLPVPLGWLAVYGSVALVRWVRKGFNHV